MSWFVSKEFFPDCWTGASNAGFATPKVLTIWGGEIFQELTVSKPIYYEECNRAAGLISVVRYEIFSEISDPTDR